MGLVGRLRSNWGSDSRNVINLLGGQTAGMGGQMDRNMHLFIMSCFYRVVFYNDRYVLQLQEVGDFGDENCLPPLNLIQSTKLHLTTEAPISCKCC